MSVSSLIAFVVVVAAAVLIAWWVLHRPGASIDARAKLGPVEGRFIVTAAVRKDVERHLVTAAQEKRLSVSHDVDLERVTTVRRLRVLWVDDTPEWIVHEVLMMRDLGHNIVYAPSSRVAEMYLATGPFDLLITDLTRDGHREAGVEMLRKLGGRIPSIVYCGILDDRANQARQAGALAVTTTPAGLLEAVLSWSEKRS